MRFSKGCTFNSHDTSVLFDANSRIKIDQTRGVSARCELAINALLRFGNKGATAEMIADHLNKRLTANYSSSDLAYALDRLVKEGLISDTTTGYREKSVYRASQNVLVKWRKARRA